VQILTRIDDQSDLSDLTDIDAGDMDDNEYKSSESEHEIDVE